MAKKAVQQIMLGSICKTEKEARDTLEKIKEAGYDGIELNSFMLEPASLLIRMLTRLAGMPTGAGGFYDWKGLLEEAALEAVSIHTDLGSIEGSPEQVIARAREFGVDKLVITGMYRFAYTEEAALSKLCARLNEAGKRLAGDGIHLLYHNHNIEFLRLPNGGFVYDYMLEHTDDRYLNFEFDSYWAAEAGADALAVMKKLGKRMKLYHINDRGSRIRRTPMTPILKSGSIEPGYGAMNLQALVAQALEVSVDAVILETHKNWVEKSPLKSLQVSSAFLKTHVR